MARSNNVISELVKGSSLHGFNRLSTSSHRPAWIMVIIVATTLWITMLSVQLYYIQNNPISTIIDVSYPTSLVQFPNVEICHNYNVERKSIRKLEDIIVKRGLARSGDDFYKSLRDFIMKKRLDVKRKEDLFNALSVLGYTYRRLILEVGISCEAMLQNCSWNGIDIDCTKMFQRVVSIDGICCRFQMDYFRNNTRDVVINYAPGYRPETGLNVAMNLTTDSNIAAGAMIYFFYSDRTYFDTWYELDIGTYTLFGITTEVRSSSSYIGNMSPLRRKCGLIDKNSPSAVDIMTKYTYDECITHYRHKAIMKKCNCIPFFVKDIDPRGDWDGANLCSAKKHDCVLSESNKSLGVNTKHNCLHACDSVGYKYTTKTRDNVVRTKSSLSIYYTSLHCNKLTKTVLATWDQIIASQGGVFSLCLGGSLISIAELLYAVGSLLFSSIRKIFQPKKDNDKSTEKIKCNQRFKSFRKKQLY